MVNPLINRSCFYISILFFFLSITNTYADLVTCSQCQEIYFTTTAHAKAECPKCAPFEIAPALEAAPETKIKDTTEEYSDTEDYSPMILTLDMSESPDDRKQRELREGSQKMAYSLLKKAAEIANTNQVLSNYSIGMLMMMMGFGAEKQTLDAIAKECCIKAEQFPDMAKWVTQPIKSSGEKASGTTEFITSNYTLAAERCSLHNKYKTFTEKYFSGFSNFHLNLPFHNREKFDPIVVNINDEISKLTQNMLSDILDAESISAANPPLIWLTATLFKGEWEEEFQTTQGGFILGNGKTFLHNLHMMRFPHKADKNSRKRPRTVDTPNPLKYNRNEAAWEAVSIPYKGGYEMVIVLPPLNTMPEAISADDLIQLTEGIHAEYGNAYRWHEVHLTMPVFQMHSKFDIQQLLQNKLFTQQACFDSMSDHSDLTLTAMSHEAAIRVDEKGTIAVAQSSGICADGSPPIEEVTINRPFMFIIKHRKTGMPVFIGRIVDPRKAKLK